MPKIYWMQLLGAGQGVALQDVPMLTETVTIAYSLQDIVNRFGLSWLA
jgi:hypothetical protein